MKVTASDTLGDRVPMTLSGLCVASVEVVFMWAQAIDGPLNRLRRALNRSHWWEDFDNCGPAALAMCYHGPEWCRQHHFSSCKRLIAISSLSSNFVEFAAAALYDVDMNSAFELFQTDGELKKLLESQQARRHQEFESKSWRYDHTWLSVVRIVRLLDTLALELQPYEERIKEVFRSESLSV